MYVSDVRKITIWQATMLVMISGKNLQYLVKLVGNFCWKIKYYTKSLPRVSVMTSGPVHTMHILAGMAEK